MIVVAVIGILSSIAIPQYQNYLKKSQLGSAMATLAALKINVEDYIVTHGQFPNVAASGMSAQLSATPSPLGSIESKTASSGQFAGQIILTLNDKTQFKDQKVAFERNEFGEWQCLTSLDSSAYLPSQCSNGSIL